MSIDIHEEYGTIFINGFGIERPTMLVDTDSDVLLNYGNYADVKTKFDKYTGKNIPAELKSSIAMFTFDTLPNKAIIYILKRAINYTASGFVKNLAKKYCEPDFQTWLNAEMLRVPITDV